MVTVIKDIRGVNNLRQLNNVVFFFDTNMILKYPDKCSDIIRKTENNECDFRISVVVLEEIKFRVVHGFGFKASGINLAKVENVLRIIEDRHKDKIIKQNPKLIIDTLKRLSDLTSKRAAYDIIMENVDPIIKEMRTSRVDINKLARLIHNYAFPNLEKVMLSRLKGRIDREHFIVHLRNTKANLLNSITGVLRIIYAERDNPNSRIKEEVAQRFNKSLEHDIRIAAHFLVFDNPKKAMLTMDKDVQELIDLFEIWSR